jgi:phosphonate transport system substrate-binding protein
MRFKTNWFKIRSKMIFIKWLMLPAVILIIGLGYNCKSKAVPYQPAYAADSSRKKILLFGVPSQSYFILSDSFVKYLNDHLKGAQVQTVASPSFLGYMDKLNNHHFNFTIVNGMKALEAIRNGYSIVSTALDKDGYAGAILVNKDSAINSISDLKGRTIATPGSPALAGHMLQMIYLFRKGLNVNKDIRPQYLESFESVIMNIYLDRCAAGFSTITAWNSFMKRRPEIGSKVALKWLTPAITANALVIRNDLDSNMAMQLRNVILSMDQNEQGRNALEKLGYSRFIVADSNSYQQIKLFLREYNAHIIDQPR